MDFGNVPCEPALCKRSDASLPQPPGNRRGIEAVREEPAFGADVPLGSWIEISKPWESPCKAFEGLCHANSGIYFDA